MGIWWKLDVRKGNKSKSFTYLQTRRSFQWIFCVFSQKYIFVKIISIIGENSYSTCGITDHANYINNKFSELGHDVKIKSLNFTNKSKSLIAKEIEQTDLAILHFAPYMYSKWGIFPISFIQYFSQIFYSNKTIMYFHLC